MLGEIFNNPLFFVFWVIALVVAITVHEFSHAYAADQLGDPTPRMQGRLTLNPLSHLDPLGTLMLLFVRFGWGKPVQFDPFNLQNPKRDAAIISLAGPASNIVTAVISAVLLHLMAGLQPMLDASGLTLVRLLLSAALQPIIILNVVLAIFNLVPIHPLDGFKIVGGLLPDEYASQWYELQPYGMFFLILLIFPIFGGASPISQFISPIISFVLSLLLPGAPIV